MGDHSRASVAECIFMHFRALKRAHCTTFLVHCAYWPTQDTSPLSVTPFLHSFSETEFYVYTTTLQSMHLVDREDGGSMYLSNISNITHNMHGIMIQEQN
jgi:hypothetical protein